MNGNRDLKNEMKYKSIPYYPINTPKQIIVEFEVGLRGENSALNFYSVAG
jgi:hypothetical protein